MPCDKNRKKGFGLYYSTKSKKRAEKKVEDILGYGRTDAYSVKEGGLYRVYRKDKYAHNALSKR